MNILDIFKRNKKQEQRGLQYISNYGGESLMFNGNAVNQSSMAISAVYRATEIISDNVAILPIILKNINKDHISEVENHNLVEIFNNRTKNNISKYTLIKLLIQSVILYGNGFAYIHRDKDGNVIDIEFLNAGEVVINYTQNKNLTYSVPRLKKRVEPINIIHLVKNSYDGINGKSVISYANRSIQNANLTENQALSFYNSGCNLAGVLTVQGQLSAEQKEQIRSSWNQAYNSNGSGLAIIPGNMSYQPIQVNASDAQLLESRQFNVQDIARFFGIHPSLLGVDGATLGSVEQIQQQFVSYTLQPYITMLEEELNRKLLKPSERNLKIKLDTNALIKTDKSATASYYSTLLDKGVMCVNEVRKELGYNKIEGGEKHIIPFTDISQNMINNEATKVEENDN